MEILIENLQDKVEIDDKLYKLLEKSVEVSLQQEEFLAPSEISILLVDNDKIREINKEQRNVDKPTDVLSFPMVDMVNGKIQKDEGDFDLDENLLLLGDIVISLETATAQAMEYGHSLDRELAFLTTHGVFHLLGYDHMEAEEEKLMIGKQESVLQEMGLTR